MRVGLDNFKAEQLILAREARGMIQADLAELSGVSATTLSNWEKKAQAPTFTNLEKVATALNFPVNWFLEDINQPDNPCYFRSLKKASQAYQNIARGKLKISAFITEKIEEWIEFPALDFPEIDIPDFMALSNDDIENIALKCRNYWKLGIAPVPNLVELLESIGVIVVRDYISSEDMDGVSTWINNRPYIFLLADKNNYFRSRFDAAHELGHLILHKNVPSHFYTKNSSTYKIIEDQANHFGSCFLLPAESISYHLAFPTLDNLTAVKKKWSVSIQALIRRAESLEIIDSVQKGRLYKNISARGWKKCEPLDLETPVEKPQTLSSAIEVLVDEGGCSKSALFEILNIYEDDIVQLCNLPKYYFNEKSNIIRFKPQ